eukprot:gene1782-2968_t
MRGDLHWAVRKTDGSCRNVSTAGGAIKLAGGPAAGYAVKATVRHNATKLFIDGVLAGVASAGPPASRIVGGSAPLVFGAQQPTPESSSRTGLVGALEEISIKNVSAQDRLGYLFAEPSIRPTGTYLVDLSRAAGRAFFASTVAGVVNAGLADTVHVDGFEKLAMIGGRDFAHSARTFSSPWARIPYSFGFPSQVHDAGWPARWGAGIVEGLALAHGGFAAATAMEVSLM